MWIRVREVELFKGLKMERFILKLKETVKLEIYLLSNQLQNLLLKI